MCVQSIKVPLRKKSGNIFNDPRMCVCLCVCDPSVLLNSNKKLHDDTCGSTIFPIL